MNKIEEEIYKLTLSDKNWYIPDRYTSTLKHSKTGLSFYRLDLGNNVVYPYSATTRAGHNFDILDKDLNYRLREIHLSIELKAKEKQEQDILESIKPIQSWWSKLFR